MKKMKQLIMLILMIVLVSISGKMTTLADEESSEENVVFTEVNDEAGLIAAIENGENVKLTADFALTSEVKIDASLIVDLNGKTVTSALNKKIFIVTGNGVKVKFTDSSVNESGLLKAIGTYGSSVAIYVEKTASVIIEKGTYIGGFASVDIELSSSVTITGGTFDGIESYYAIFNDGGNLNIHGGTFKVVGNPIVSMNSGMTKVIGGEFYNENTSVTIVMLQYEGGTLDLSGFTGKEYKVDFLEVPSTEQIIIPEKYAWFDWSNNKYDEVNSERFLILSKLVKLSFNANGGSGTMATVETVAGECELPKCEFVAPDGLGFLGWSETPNGDEYTRLYYDATSDMTLYAIWGKVYDVYMGNVGMEDGDYLAVGADKTTKTKPATGGYAYYKDGVLTLSDYEYKGEGYWYEYDYSTIIYSELDELEIVLEGENLLKNTEPECEGITFAGNTLKISGTGSLKVDAYYGIYVFGEFDADGLLISDNALIIEDGNITIESDDDAIYCEGRLTINGGKLTIDAFDDGIVTYDDFTMNDGEIYIFTVDDDAFDLSGDANVTIKGGIINIESRDDGFSLWGSFIIEDGVVNITSTNDDGIWAETGIIIRGGSITLDASDNGISTAGDVLVEAGVVTVKCEGYCFESSGKVEINGGVVILNTSSDKENDDIAAIMAFEEIVFGENVEMKIPKDVKIGEIKVEYDSPDKFDYFKVLEDADGNVATSVKIQEKLQLKEAVTLNNPVLVIGQKLSTVKLNNVKVVNPFGDIIEGTISWKEPDTVIGAATKTATWVFTPSNSAYDVIEGTISLPGAIEAPDTGDMSPVSWLMVGMLLIVVCVCGVSLKRENYN